MFSNKQYDIVLVQPPAKQHIEQYDTPDYPAIGIGYVGGYLEKKFGHTPAIVDARLARLTIEETVRAVVRLQPKVVGISSLTHTVLIANELANHIKKQLPTAQLVLGGVHATFLPERSLKEFPVFDYVVAGEGEKAFGTLVTDIIDGKKPGKIKGVCYFDKGHFIDNGRSDYIQDLDDVDSPGYHLFDQEVLKKNLKTLPVITQRGCPFTCNFCSRPYGKTVRKRTNSSVIQEINENISRYSPNKIEFYDETFSADRAKTLDLCQQLNEKQFQVPWICSTHVSKIDEQLIDAMIRAGCNDIRTGVESGNLQIIKQMGKAISHEQILKAYTILKKKNITTTAFFLMGHPNENHKTLWETIRFAILLNADKTAIGIMVPYPGTKIWQMATQGTHGYKKLSTNWQDYNKQLGNAVELEHIPRRMLEFYQIVCYGLIFLVNLRFRDFFSMLSENKNLVRKIIIKICTGKSDENSAQTQSKE